MIDQFVEELQTLFPHDEVERVELGVSLRLRASTLLITNVVEEIDKLRAVVTKYADLIKHTDRVGDRTSLDIRILFICTRQKNSTR